MFHERPSHLVPSRLIALLASVLHVARMSKLAAAGLGVLFLACSQAPPRELAVFASTSLREPLLELAKRFEAREHVHVRFTFGAAGDLAQQLVAGTGADVFFAADELDMDRLAQAGLIRAETRRAHISNRLAVVVPRRGADDAANPFADPRSKEWSSARVAIGNVESVAAGRYARAWLEREGLWSAVKERLSFGIDETATLLALEGGAADVGIVYESDARRSPHARTVLAIAATEGPRIAYPVAVMKRSQNGEKAALFVELASSKEARDLFEGFGFPWLADAAPLK
jgi:molybdate transport system substrate-binding protein